MTGLLLLGKAIVELVAKNDKTTMLLGNMLFLKMVLSNQIRSEFKLLKNSLNRIEILLIFF